MHLYRVTLFPFEERQEEHVATDVHGGCVGIFQDITEFRRRAEVARRQKALLDSVNASLQAGLMLMDGDGLVQMCNPAFGHMVNLEEAKVVGSTIDSMLPTEAADNLLSGMERVAADGRENSLEISVPGKDTTRLYRVTLFPFEAKKDAQVGDTVHGGCVGIFQDITEFRRRAEVSRRQKALLDSVNASLQVGLMLMDGDGRVQMCNPAFSSIAEKSEDALVGIAIDDILPAVATENMYAGMERVNSSGKEYSLEIALHDKDTRLYRVTLYPFEEKQGEKAAGNGGCVGIFQDITEFRRRAEAARKRQANSMAALIRAIESVDANLVGHSLKMERVAELVCNALKLSDADRETLRFAARLSQVGKLFVPRDLLTKKGKLTPEEQIEVHRAPEYAYNILRDMQFSLPVPEAVYQMGERMDGTGQPRRLKGEEIASNARVLAVVNAFCAMVSARSYRAGMRPEQAIDLLRNDSGFDQHIVAALAGIDAGQLAHAVTDVENGDV
ncbi:MAG: PAS domain-containing protein [Desulfovibrio sp.]|nr:PAS domain-containing protein [Desulfovibrio sp.]